MNVQCTWNEKLQFSANTQRHSIMMDTIPPLGTDTAMSPKQLLLASVCGCTGMDVIALLKKGRQLPESLIISAEAPIKAGSKPAVFESIHLLFQAKGTFDRALYIDAVEKSQSLYCGVSAMVSGVVPILYTLELNGEKIHEGVANFPKS